MISRKITFFACNLWKSLPPKKKLGCGFKYFLCSPGSLGKWSNLTRPLPTAPLSARAPNFAQTAPVPVRAPKKKTTQSHSFQQIAALSKVWIKPQLRPYWRAGIGVGGPLRFSLHEGWIQSLAGCLFFFLQIIGLGKFLERGNSHGIMNCLFQRNCR